ncbi:MAG: hypothetical protein ACJ8AT_38865 [Hyalangium sp.]|uniref:hypothetical protein n=1 Tax=Hyalangium sp. TaxID=2028555 RepID=UPI00389AA7BD
MSLSRWTPALLAALALTGCKSHDEPSSTAQGSGTPAASASAKGSTPAPTPAPAPVPAPASGPALSYLKDTSPKSCDWVRQPLPSGEPAVVYSFQEPCSQAMVSWSPDGKEGLVFVPPAVKAWRVDLVAHTGKPLDLKALLGSSNSGEADTPSIEELGFDKQGRPVALLEDIYSERKPEKGKDGQAFVTFEGQRYPLNENQEGEPGLAHAYRLEEGGWKHVETKASHFETDLAPGIRILKAGETLMPVVPEPGIGGRMPGEEASESAAKKLDVAFPGQDADGQWMSLSTPGGTLYYRGSQGGEFLFPSVPVAWEQGGKLVPVKGLSAKPEDPLELEVQDGLLLISNYSEPYVAQVWDTRTKERVFTAEQANAPTFWPKPGGP